MGHLMCTVMKIMFMYLLNSVFERNQDRFLGDCFLIVLHALFQHF
jgi:hypothetical protein